MGLSSSQARLLNLTSRMHQIEYKAAKLEAEKLQMANESDRVYGEYLDALEMTKIQRKKLTSSGAVTYADVTSYDDFTGANFALVRGNVTYQAGGANGGLYKDASNNAYQYTKMTVQQGESVILAGETDPLPAGTDYYVQTNTSNQQTTNVASIPSDYTQMTAEEAWNQLLTDLGVAVPHSTDFEKVLTNVINTGEVVIVTKDGGDSTFNSPINREFHLFQTSVATNTNLQEVQDESVLRVAEAKYEADMRKIDRKERKFDADLATLDNERNAIKQEMDTLKTVAKENVDRTFKLFS